MREIEWLSVGGDRVAVGESESPLDPEFLELLSPAPSPDPLPLMLTLGVFVVAILVSCVDEDEGWAG